VVDLDIRAGESLLTRVLTRRFADPTKLVLALCEKRTERMCIEQIYRAKDLICKKVGATSGAPWGQLMSTTDQREERRGGEIGRRDGSVPQAQPHTRTHSKHPHPQVYSCAPQSRR